VLCQGTMAGFAVDIGVLARRLHCQNICVTGLTGFVSGKVDGTGSNLRNSGSAVVAIFSEALGYDKVPDHKEDSESNDEQKSEPEKMSCIFEKVHRVILPSKPG